MPRPVLRPAGVRAARRRCRDAFTAGQRRADLRAVRGAKITAITATTSHTPDTTGNHAGSPIGYGITLRYSVYPSTTRPAIGTTICHIGTGSLCRTNTSMMQPPCTYTTSRISVPMVPDHRKLLKAAGWAATAAWMAMMTAAATTTTRVAQTGVPQRELLWPSPRSPAVSRDSA